jgi:hypothetical protein
MNSEKSRHATSPGFREMQSVHLPTRGPKEKDSGIRWVKMTPMAWIDALNAKAKASEELKKGSMASFKTDTTKPTVTETPPPRSAFVMPPSGEKRARDAFATGSNFQGGAQPQPSFPASSSSLDTLPADVAKLLSEVKTASMPLFWDFGCLQPSEQVEKIRRLVLAIEGQTKFMEMKPAFEQVRDHFTFSLSQCRASQQFEMLCQDTIGRLQSLLLILVNKLQEGNTIGSTQSTPRAANGNVRSSLAAPNKALFHNHMNNWLRANWINPYPDEAVSHQLAYETGETLHVVNTWLVNARSRRWRPAVLKAFELNRPSELLWEDSIALFEGKPLRSMEGQASAANPKRLRLK